MKTSKYSNIAVVVFGISILALLLGQMLLAGDQQILSVAVACLGLAMSAGFWLADIDTLEESVKAQARNNAEMGLRESGALLKVDQLQQELVDLHASGADFEMEWGMSKEAYAEQAMREIKGHPECSEELKRQLDDANWQVKNLASKNIELVHEISSLKAELGSAKGEVGALKGEVASLKASKFDAVLASDCISSLEKQVDSLTREKLAFQEQIQCFDSAFLIEAAENAKQELASIKADKSALYAKVITARGEASQLKSDLVYARKRLAEQRTELKETKQQIESFLRAFESNEVDAVLDCYNSLREEYKEQ